MSLNVNNKGKDTFINLINKTIYTQYYQTDVNNMVLNRIMMMGKNEKSLVINAIEDYLSKLKELDITINKDEEHTEVNLLDLTLISQSKNKDELECFFSSKEYLLAKQKEDFNKSVFHQLEQERLLQNVSVDFLYYYALSTSLLSYYNRNDDLDYLIILIMIQDELKQKRLLFKLLNKNASSDRYAFDTYNILESNHLYNTDDEDVKQRKILNAVEYVHYNIIPILKIPQNFVSHKLLLQFIEIYHYENSFLTDAIYEKYRANGMTINKLNDHYKLQRYIESMVDVSEIEKLHEVRKLFLKEISSFYFSKDEDRLNTLFRFDAFEQLKQDNDFIEDVYYNLSDQLYMSYEFYHKVKDSFYDCKTITDYLSLPLFDQYLDCQHFFGPLS